ncbi:MAG TPA: tRNA (adenosine(37)-N6)-threonylcarbamoyltransferase complex ATPase subunit type 1 TsaE [Candidatus Baltobacteraceae bacterium]|nr:tRNA (adenosine(37)-N6)-threonylcarbamoyltransferase complex ATPase subunit type 1 TsaE [Candidatus Baltobacteraceae bacterium]
MGPRFANRGTRTFSDEATFVAFAAAFARQLRPGDVVALSGPLGSGKTTFVRAVVRALHGADRTSSPTFTFWHRYPGSPPIDHLDLYRIEDARETAELGLEEAFDGSSIALIEWPEKAPHLVTGPRYDVQIDGAGEAPRNVTIQGPA